MNTEDSEFERIEREQAMRGVPDAIHHTDPAESLEYITGWNDCRQAMMAEQPAQQHVSVTDELVDAYCKAWEQSFTADNPYDTVKITAEARKHVEDGLKAALATQPAPVHCEAGPEYCQQCHKEAFEDRSLALAAAVRYVKNNTPNLVWAEINRALATPQAQRKPLTPTLEADTGCSRAQRAAFEEGWKEAEAAHNIKEDT